MEPHFSLNDQKMMVREDIKESVIGPLVQGVINQPKINAIADRPGLLGIPACL
jgi:hypothetical protein